MKLIISAVAASVAPLAFESIWLAQAEMNPFTARDAALTVLADQRHRGSTFRSIGQLSSQVKLIGSFQFGGG
jgi:hypothetical protein